MGSNIYEQKVHLALLINYPPVVYFQPKATGEQKTKPTQASIRELRGLGLSPDLVITISYNLYRSKVEQKIMGKHQSFYH